MSDFIEKKKNVIDSSILAKKDYKNILMLSYYRNNLAHVFMNEAFICCSLLAFGEKQCVEEGVLLKRVEDWAFFLADLF